MEGGGERKREEREREMWHYNINFGMVCTASDDKDLLVLINTVRKTLLEFLVTEACTLSLWVAMSIVHA